MPLLIHPGFHKTGTTWLQKELFENSPQFSSLLGQYEIDDVLVKPHDLDFSAGPAIEAITARRSKSGGAIDVLSSELLVGNPLFGSRDAATLASRLHEVVPDAKILLTTREQGGMLRSLYQQYLKRGGTQKLETFVQPNMEPGYFAFHPDLLRYERFAMLYERLFGPGSVLVLPHELLLRDPRRFLEALFEFATGTVPTEIWLPEMRKVGRSPPPGATDLIRFSNRLRQTVLNPGAPRITRPAGEVLFRAAYRYPFSSARQSAQWQRTIDPLLPPYREANRDLQRFCPVPLGAFRYPMPQQQP